MDAERLVSALEDVGLTQYQSRAYLAAVTLGTARFSALAEEADIPQQRIYDVVDDVERAGLVEVHEGSGGKEVVALPPETALSEFKRQHIEEFTDSVDTVIDDLQESFKEVDTSRGFVTVVNHESSMRRHMRKAVEAAEWWLLLSMPPQQYEALSDSVTQAVNRGVTVRLLLHADELVDAGSVPEGVLVRQRGSADTIVAADREYGIYRGLSSPALARPALVTRDENIVEMIQRYSEQFWSAAEPIREERSFPRRYLTPWQVIADLGDAVGTDGLGARVAGHFTNTGREGVWEGPVVDFDCSVPIEDPYRSQLPEVATLAVETDDGTLSVGGWDATDEDVAAHGIEMRRVD